MAKQARTAVIGCGIFGGYHADKHAASSLSDFVAVADCDSAAAKNIAEKHNVRAVQDYRALIGKVDAVSITVPTVAHFDVARDFLDAGVDVLVEKPIARDLGEARALVALAQANNCILQVGHLERFSAVTTALKPRIAMPYFIDAIRAGPFQQRGTDVSVVLDLMIHDLDLVLWFANSEITGITASGHTAASENIDFAEARLTFANGCVAHLVASRIHPARERQMRLFQSSEILTADFERRCLSRQEVPPTNVAENGAAPGEHEFLKLSANNDPVGAEIESFLHCVHSRDIPFVTGGDGLSALEAALLVERAISGDSQAEIGADRRGNASAGKSGVGESVQCVS